MADDFPTPFPVPAPQQAPEPFPNGQQPPQSTPGVRIPRRTEWMVLPWRDLFPDDPEPAGGLRFRCWVTYPRRLIDDIRSGDEDRMKAALRQIVLEHNGWIGDDGNPLPPATDERFWDEIPDSIGGAIIAAVQAEVGKAAASVMRRRRS